MAEIIEQASMKLKDLYDMVREGIEQKEDDYDDGRNK